MTTPGGDITTVTGATVDALGSGDGGDGEAAIRSSALGTITCNRAVRKMVLG